MRELQGIQAYAVVSKQMELKEGQVFVKANAIKTRGLKQDWKKKKRAKVKQKAKQKANRSQQQGDFVRPKRERMLQSK
jgi:hypothetical protein